MSDQNEHVIEHLHELRTASDAPYQGWGPEAARMRAAQRRRHRRGAVAAALILLIVVAGVALSLRPEGPDRLQPVTPPTTAGSPTPAVSSASPSPERTGSTPSSSPTTSAAGPDSAPAKALGAIDWGNSVMNLPKNDMCPHTRVQFTNGKASFPPWQYSIDRYGPPVYGDFTGDGLTDAAVVFECHGDADTGGPESRIVVAAFTGNSKGGPAPLGVLYAEQSYVDPRLSLEDDRSTIVVDFRPANGNPDARRYRWNGSRFTQVG